MALAPEARHAFALLPAVFRHGGVPHVSRFSRRGQGSKRPHPLVDSDATTFRDPLRFSVFAASNSAAILSNSGLGPFQRN